MKYIFLLLFMLLGEYTHAQYGWQWARTSDETIYSENVEGYLAAVDGNNNVYAGMVDKSRSLTFGGISIYNPRGLRHSSVIKYDATGKELWALSLDGSNTLIDLATDEDGNLYLFGNFTDTLQMGSTMLIAPQPQYFIAKLSSAGIVLWAINDGGACADGFTPMWYYSLNGGIKVKGDDLYITTSFNSKTMTVGASTFANADATGLTYDILLAKYTTTTGALVWAKTAGGTDDDYTRAFTLSPSGHCFVAGTSLSPSMTFGSKTLTNAIAPAQKMYIAEYDAAGNAVWATNAGSNTAMPTTYATAMTSDSKDNIYITGTFKDTMNLCGRIIGNPDPAVAVVFLAKIDTGHHVSWFKVITASPSFRGGIGGRGVATDQCNNVWIAGTMGNIPVHGVTPNIPYVIVDGNIIDSPVHTGLIAAAMTSIDPGFIAGFNDRGTYLGGTSALSGFDDGTTMVCGKGGQIYIGADLECCLIAGRDTIKDASLNERFLLLSYKYDTVHCSDCIMAFNAAFTHTGTPVVSFSYTGTPVYDSIVWHYGDGATATGLINPVHEYTATGIYTVCVQLYSSCLDGGYNEYCKDVTIAPSAVSDHSAGNTLLLYPNPVRDVLHINGAKGTGAYCITDITGKKVLQGMVNRNGTVVNVSKIPAGMYLLHVTDETGERTESRITKE